MTEPTGPGVLEPTTDAVPTTALDSSSSDAANAPAAAPRRAHRLRWALAAVGSAAVIAMGALGFAVVASGSSPSSVLPWAPADAIVYAEIRADLPGDQRANLLAFLSHFPGFADQTNFDVKADEGLDRLVQRMTDNKHDFSTEIKPWFSGQLGVSVESGNASQPTALLVGSVRDAAAATAWLKSIEPAGATTSTVNGVVVTQFAGSSSGETDAWAVDGSVVLAGSVDVVKAAATSGPSNGLANEAGFKAAEAALGGDALGTVYVDVKDYVQVLAKSEAAALSQMGSQTGGAIPSLAPLTTLDPALLPGWTALRVRAESDHLVLDSATPLVGTPVAGVSERESVIASSLPPSTVAQAEVRDVGPSLKADITQLEKLPGGPTPAQVDDLAKYLGGVDAAIGWIGDADAVVIHPGAAFEGGLVAQTTDATASANLVTAIKSLVSLGGSKAGISLSTETYDGHAITIVHVTASDAAKAPEIAFTQTDQLVIVGIGDGFVKAVLDTKAGDSLADQAAYQRAIGLAGASNVGQGFVNLTAVRTGLEALAPAKDRAAYEANIQPYLVPIESLAWSRGLGSDLTTARIVLVLK